MQAAMVFGWIYTSKAVKGLIKYILPKFSNISPCENFENS